MEISYALLALLCAVFLSHRAWKILKSTWIEPRKIEKLLREQGFNGNSYRFMIGDFKEMVTIDKEAKSKPIAFSHDIAPRVLPFIHHALQKYGENCMIWFGPKPAVVISDEEMMKEVLLKNYVFQKDVSSHLTKLLAQGVAVYDGDKWAKHRRLLNPAFHLEKLKLMLPSIYSSCGEMLSKLEEVIPIDGSCEVDVWPYLQAMSGDVISRTAFGSSYEEARKIFELQREQGALIVQALPIALIPGWRFLPTKINRRMKQVAKEVDSCILGIINKRMSMIEAGETEFNDLLGILLDSNFKEITQNGNELGMSLREVIDECKLFYIAGQETTSALLVWTMILLSKHPEWQARARDEVMQVIGDGQPDFQDLNRLHTVTMIFHEVQRLYPGGVILSRAVHNQTTTAGSVTLPAGVHVLLPTLRVQQDCNIWGEDAKGFDPRRFSEGVSKATKGRFVYFPFGGGPRICIGQNFAMLEAKMALALVLKRYRFELSPSYTHAPEIVLSLYPQYGAPLILQRLH